MKYLLPKKSKELKNEIYDNLGLYLKNVSYDEHLLYHRSPYDIKLYDHDYVVSIRKERNTHNNSVLGLWASTRPYLCRGFGEFNYQVMFKKDLRVKGIEIRDFFNLTSELIMEDQLKLRMKLLEICDILYIIDATKCINEVIVINTEAISILKVSNEIPDSLYKLYVLN